MAAGCTKRVRVAAGVWGVRVGTTTPAYVFEREHMSLSASICPCVVRVKTRLGSHGLRLVTVAVAGPEATLVSC